MFNQEFSFFSSILFTCQMPGENNCHYKLNRNMEKVTYSAVFPSQSFASISSLLLYCRSNFTHAIFPREAALCKGVAPLSSLVFGSAWWCSSSSAIYEKWRNWVSTETVSIVNIVLIKIWINFLYSYKSWIHTCETHAVPNTFSSRIFF